MTWGVRIAPPCSRKQKERVLRPAIADRRCQLKLNSRMGV